MTVKELVNALRGNFNPEYEVVIKIKGEIKSPMKVDYACHHDKGVVEIIIEEK